MIIGSGITVGSGVRFRVGTAFVDSATSITPNTWTHVAITRNNASCRIFLNGKLDASLSNIETADAQTTPTVGNETSGSSYPYIGLIDDLRVTKGLARYTTDFTPPARALSETGGKSFVTTNVNAGVAQRFTTVGTTAWTAPTDVTNVEVLVVAGGAGGASGGGGAGGVIYNNQYAVTPGQTYTVTVGAGGTGGTGSTSGAAATNGGVSQFGNLTATGGGAGARTGNTGDTSGAVGGSGGGGGGYSSGTVAGGAGTAGQGFAGGSNGNQGGSPYPAGGGGGAGAAAANVSASTVSTAGGIGLQFGISGTPTYYAGGGGGGSYGGGTAGAGGTGGGGAGGSAGGGTAGTANTGGGGGGANSSTTGGAGGSGVVIVRYTTQSVGNSSDATTDNLVDSPTLYGHDTGAGGEVVGNYATWNPLVNVSATFSNGNLRVTPTLGNATPATIFVSTGKWYWEVTMDALGSAGAASQRVGVVNTAGSGADLGGSANGWCFLGDGRIYNNGSTNNYGSALAANDIVNVALDLDAGKIWYGKNGSWFASGAPASGTSPSQTFTANQSMSPAVASGSGSPIYSGNFGQRAWAYTPPAGYNAITTKNLPRLAIGSAAATPNQYFDAVTWTGDQTNKQIPLNFTADFVWAKRRNSGDSHRLYDVIRGVNNDLQSNSTSQELTNNYGLDFDNGNYLAIDGTQYFGGGGGSGITFVAWCWRAGGAAVSNTSGTITSQVSANTTSGFSVVTYTGNGTAGETVGHGLGVAPNLVIWKKRSSTSNWFVWSKAMDVLTGVTGWLYLNATNSQQTSGSTNEYPTYKVDPTSTLITLNGTGSSNGVNDSSATYVAYCWTEIPGFSKFGSWTNNNSNDGTFVYLGFKPAFVMLKNTDNVETWYIIDAKRPGYNVAAGSGSFLVPNSSGAEGVAGADTATVDFVSNGFKIRTSNPASGEISFGTRNYIYMAFAEAPFGNVNGVAR